MNETLLTRIGNWFKKGNRIDRELPLDPDGAGGGSNGGTSIVEHRSTFLRPWAKRNQAIANLQEGVSALSGLMNSIRDNLESQGRRQEELLGYLSHLPEALAAIPETGRVQSETLKAIHQQISQQSGQQQRLAEILDRISTAANDHKSTLDALQDRVETLHEHDAAISENLNSVGSAMQNVSRSSQESTKVLEQLRENMTSRDTDLHTLLKKQEMRFTYLLLTAIVLSIAALIGVGLVGWLGYDALQQMR